MEEYSGKNTLTEFNKIKIKEYAFNCFISLIFLFLGYIFIIFLIEKLNVYTYGIIYSIVIIALIFSLLFINIILVFLIVFIINIIKKIKINFYYSNNKLINIKKIMIEYDYKLWLTAPKDSFHPMCIKIDECLYKTDIIFTNSNRYYLFHMIRIPSILNPKNYINNRAIVGYDEKNQKYVIINYETN